MKLALAVVAALSAAPVLAAPVSLGEVRQNLFATCFATDRDGWMVGELGRVFRTRDGGASWERQEVGTKRPFLAMSCVDARTAWIAGKEGIVYATHDGGATWEFQQTGSNRHLFALQFADARRGHGAGDFGTMVHSEDGGAGWDIQQVPPDVRLPEVALDTGVEPGDVNLYGISYGDRDHVWIAGEFGIVIHSDDGGRTWRQQHPPIESTLFGVRFLDTRRGWAVGVDSVIVHTDDGGTTWTVLTAPVTQRSFYDVMVVGRQGWIVGDSGTVLRSSDSGESWQLEPLPIQLAANWIRAVWLSPGGRGLAVGSEGLVFRVEGASLRRLEERAAEERAS